MQTGFKRFFISFQWTVGMVTMVNLLFTMVTLLQVKCYLKTLYKLSMNKHFYIQSKIFNILDFYGLLFWIVVLLWRLSIICFLSSVLFIPSETLVLNYKVLTKRFHIKTAFESIITWLFSYFHLKTACESIITWLFSYFQIKTSSTIIIRNSEDQFFHFLELSERMRRHENRLQDFSFILFMYE